MLQSFYRLMSEKPDLAGYVQEGSVTAHITDGEILCLDGQVDTWQQVVDIGHIAGTIGQLDGVVNNLTAKGIQTKKLVCEEDIESARRRGSIATADVVIIGAGISGCAVARELSKYELGIIVVEQNEDISEGTTKANNGMIHSGYDSKPETLKAKLNVRGNALYGKWAEELNFHFVRSGSFVAGFNEGDARYIQMYYERGLQNGVPGIAVLSGDEARRIEPSLSEEVTLALWTPSAAYVEPYEVALALAENAADNDAVFMLGTKVLAIDAEGGRVASVVTDRGLIHTRYVVNAAGLYADDIAAMAGDKTYTIHPRRGTLVVFDKEKKGTLARFVGTPPSNFTKGGGPMETPEGNSLWGPSAIEVPDKDNTEVDQEDIDSVIKKGMSLVRGFSPGDVITFFSGLRACDYKEDFIIGASAKVGGFIHVAAIQSPGLAAAPAVAEMVENILLELDPAIVRKKRYDPIRPKPVSFRECSREEQDELISRDPRYGRIICRCETVTEAEIVNAIRGKIPATTVDGVKRRTRAGMGRCQGGFCGPRIVEILARELDKPAASITLKGPGSEILAGKAR